MFNGLSYTAHLKIPELLESESQSEANKQSPETIVKTSRLLYN